MPRLTLLLFLLLAAVLVRIAGSSNPRAVAEPSNLLPSEAHIHVEPVHTGWETGGVAAGVGAAGAHRTSSAVLYSAIDAPSYASTAISANVESTSQARLHRGRCPWDDDESPRSIELGLITLETGVCNVA